MEKYRGNNSSGITLTKADKLPGSRHRMDLTPGLLPKISAGLRGPWLVLKGIGDRSFTVIDRTR